MDIPAIVEGDSSQNASGESQAHTASNVTDDAEAPQTDIPLVEEDSCENASGESQAHAASNVADDADDPQGEWPPISQIMQSCFVFEPAAPTEQIITVMGVDCAIPHNPGHLTSEQQKLLSEADVICAGQPLLNTFFPATPSELSATLKAEPLPLTFPLDPLLNRFTHLRAAGKRVLVLADGDPLFFGIGATLVRHLGTEAVRLLPAVSSLQQACARLALPWHNVICLSLHGRDDMCPLNAASSKNMPLCLLTDDRMSPDVLARHLLDRGVDWFEAHIFERMGAPDEKIWHMSLTEAAGSHFGPACTMILLPRGLPRRPCLGLQTSQLAIDGECITKQPVRAAALSLLQIAPRHVVWDIGSGSGAVALEASILAHEGRVIAVERSAGRAMGIQENRRRMGAAIVDVRLGQAPECLPSLPDPDRVFIGGGLSGEDGADILGHVCLRLPEGGRVVASCALLESLHLCRRYFEKLAWPVELLQICAAEGQALGDDLHLVGMNPIFLIAAQKPGSESASA
ncbi:MAG: precorrin-6y C5,15-methyltransferase (decarboxylating) subunit CbiE [Desulfovibrio sp.]|nr:precorrin-6y C5,15-methyltransferase (decarboxylating) subunit CbiE [Desulfovibrio sp.]